MSAAEDPDSAPAEPLDRTYNPALGAAYYFTPHGKQLRVMPTYDIQGSNSNNDDLPEVDAECKKAFPQVDTVSLEIFACRSIHFSIACPSFRCLKRDLDT